MINKRIEKIIGIETNYGIITGRNRIYLDSISYCSETELIIHGEFDTDSDFKKYEIKFSRIVYMKSIELDFDERDSIENLGFLNI